MARTDNKILALLGFEVTGDLGPWTLYTSHRHALVFYARVPSLDPASVRQTVVRTKWTAAATAWRALTAPQRAAYERASRVLSLRITGYNLWVYWRTTGDRDTIRTIERQAGQTLAT